MRPKPYEEGCLKTIYKKILLPLVALKPPNTDLKDWLNELFCIKERTIERYKAIADFHLPGLYWAAPHRLFPGFEYRFINKGDEVWVRKDKTMPDRIDVEVFNGVGEKNRIFALTRNEFSSIHWHIKPDRFRLSKRERYSWE